APCSSPCSTFQPSTACLPVRFISALAKQGPVQTSQVRASMYFPVSPAAQAGIPPISKATAASRNRRFIGRNLIVYGLFCVTKAFRPFLTRRADSSRQKSEELNPGVCSRKVGRMFVHVWRFLRRHGNLLGRKHHG